MDIISTLVWSATEFVSAVVSILVSDNDKCAHLQASTQAAIKQAVRVSVEQKQ
jgi:hypothetical protein